ncbi:MULTISPECIES: PaaX family transcriptional regulator C-terminal domain-containing protein [Thermocrispum]|jgi:phenylacetic acid degradation operon negative regulatory protein|uniref:PaaX family transcriptional regulator n=1 Tax=Thermocrispum TaxID=37924 RepID=UPI000427CDEF|nr:MULTISPECIES: PaaX family transcriptional regulator C-terminal domain-containing protein [Thermocrispum]
MASAVRQRKRPGRGEGVIADLRDIALRSAPALLLVILGEFVLPRRQPVWSSTLIRALGECGVEAVAARKAIQRTAERGTITDVRHGRKVRWMLTGTGTTMITKGAERVLGFTGETREWDGTWLIVNTTVPESHRNLRYHLRTRLTWAGMGSPAPGTWISPHAARADEVAGIITGLGLADWSMSYVGRFGPVGDERRTVQRAWDLEDLHRHYAEFLQQFRLAAVDDEASAFRQQVELVQAYRRFPYLDPALPAALTSGGWIGVEAAKLFHSKRSEWSEQAHRYWERLCAETEGG